MTDAHQVLSRNPGDIQCQNGTSRVVETESSDEKSPDGGLQAWLVVLGSWCAMVPSMGLLNTIDVLHAWTATHQLTGYSESQIGWVFGTYAFFLYFGAAQIGPIFDSKGVLPVVVPESIGLIVSIFCFSESTEYYQVLFSFSILGGISSCCLFTPAISAIGHWFDIRRGLATGIACTAGGLGGVFFSLIVLYISPNLGFPWAMRIIAIISMVLCILACLLPGILRQNGRMSLAAKYASRYSIRREEASSMISRRVISGTFLPGILTPCRD
ncbi:major facilitator superfamily domain-containing protein [Aspergillus cavernicola]|uniref:Major facilitator superfamily domain-containing protein n=1 Tax=Aspergillus cavernicola TaxID=176166 RepID=A0ABR4J1H5_9EURO